MPLRSIGGPKRGFPMRLQEAFASPDNKRRFNRDLFRVVAPRYAFITRVLSFGRDRAWKKQLVRALPEHAAAFCVDLACGNGDITRLLVSRYPEGTVIGIDLSGEMLQRARASCRGRRVQFLEADLQHTGLDDACADVVTAGYALRNAPDPRKALDEMARILKPCGTLAILDFSRSASPFLWKIQWAMLWLWGGFWGLLLHGSPAVYGYIASSLGRFPDRRQLPGLLAARGLQIAERRPGFFGMVETIVAVKERMP